jgi:hypothetical protein
MPTVLRHYGTQTGFCRRQIALLHKAVGQRHHHLMAAINLAARLVASAAT